MDINPTLLTLSAFDGQFGRFLARLAGDEAEELFLAAALASASLADGHTCLDLSRVAGTTITWADSEAATRAPALALWRDALNRSSVVGEPGSWRPLILQGNLLYLYRYWRYEETLVAAIRRQAPLTDEAVDMGRLGEGIRRLLPPTKTPLIGDG